MSSSLIFTSRASEVWLKKFIGFRHAWKCLSTYKKNLLTFDELTFLASYLFNIKKRINLLNGPCYIIIFTFLNQICNYHNLYQYIKRCYYQKNTATWHFSMYMLRDTLFKLPIHMSMISFKNIKMCTENRTCGLEMKC